MPRRPRFTFASPTAALSRHPLASDL